MVKGMPSDKESNIAGGHCDNKFRFSQFIGLAEAVDCPMFSTSSNSGTINDTGVLENLPHGLRAGFESELEKSNKQNS